MSKIDDFIQEYKEMVLELESLRIDIRFKERRIKELEDENNDMRKTIRYQRDEIRKLKGVI